MKEQNMVKVGEKKVLRKIFRGNVLTDSENKEEEIKYSVSDKG